ncbi:hypothetical protein CLOM_g6458 [Closterium sp. NIES-68]|nr:hypothetical protein CLOM_g6458 [Closterium sp. NIES-68]GJP86836.1 hypothetical protein CLOP_g16811 [Closterium sp. NIES-67]
MKSISKRKSRKPIKAVTLRSTPFASVSQSLSSHTPTPTGQSKTARNDQSDSDTSPDDKRPAWLVKFWREAGSVMVALGWGGGGAAGGSAPTAVDPRRLGAYLKALRGQTRVLLKQLPLWERAGIGALAGGLAGGLTNATLHPLDTVKTKLQTKGSSLVYSGPLDVIRKVSAAQGIGGFYRGLPAAFLGSVLSSSIYFGTYELAKGGLSRDITLRLPFSGLRRAAASSSGGSSLYSEKISSRGNSGGESTGSRQEGSGSSVVLSCPVALVPPVAAALGNITSSAILVPKEVIKQRMQAGASGSALHVLQQTVALEGVAGLYSGYLAALLRNLPTNVLNFSTFEYLKMAILHVNHSTSLRPHESMAAGGIAGALSAALTTPLDVVKTRLMTQARVAVAAAGTTGAKAEVAARAQAAAAYTYKGVASTLKHIWVEEGLRGLTRGMTSRILYNAAFSAIGFLSFETARSVLLQAHVERRARKQLQEDAKCQSSEEQVVKA